MVLKVKPSELSERECRKRREKRAQSPQGFHVESRRREQGRLKRSQGEGGEPGPRERTKCFKENGVDSVYSCCGEDG